MSWRPDVECLGDIGELWFMPHMMEPGDDAAVAARLTELLAGAALATAQAEPAVATARL